MPPPTMTRSAFAASTFMMPSLSFTFAPPVTATKGRSGASSSASSVATSRSRLGPRRARHQRRGDHDRGVRAVRRAEGLVHVVVKPLDQRRAKGRVVGLLAGIEAQVLQQLDRRARARARQRRSGSTLKRSSTRPFGRPKWVQATTVAPRSSSRSKSGSGRAQTKVVGDAEHAVHLGDGRVEVHAHQHALAGEVSPSSIEAREARHANAPT